jgi:O-acetyl-ADP-ribose deacetylase (regulator of RNase III)
VTELVVIRGDITTIEVDAIVNAANSSLLGGGGVDGAIHRVGGPAILAECREIRARQGECVTGDAVATTAGDLPARWVIHTVGPVWSDDDTDDRRVELASAYRRSLEVAEELGARSVAFPNISTGVYRFPKPLAAEIAVSTVREKLADSSLERVVFVCFDDENEQLYRERV